MKSLFLVVASIALTQCFSSVPSCSSDKAELTGERLQTLVELNKGLSANKTSTTFNLDWFLSRLAPLFTPDISYHVPLGVGHLVGLNDVAEYLALSFSSVNANLYYLNASSESPNDDLSIDGDVYTISASVPLTFFPTVTPSVEAPFKHETEIVFSPCSEKIVTYTVKRTPSFDNFVRMTTWTAIRSIHSTYQGMFDVCAFHEAYCTGEHRQYESFSSCLANLTALPDVPVGCPWAPFAGHAKPCKARHSNLAPFDSNHCYHMGPLTLADGTPNYDLNGKLKCSDAEECPAQTDFVLGEPTAEFLASMNAYDAAIATEYNNPFTNFSVDHYKFPKLA